MQLSRREGSKTFRIWSRQADTNKLSKPLVLDEARQLEADTSHVGTIMQIR